MNEVTKIKPTNVLVSFSESPEFARDEKMAFHIFESRAQRAADKCEMGYEKTDVTVFFDNEDEVSVRVDLCKDTTCFQKHVANTINYYKSSKVKSMMSKYYSENEKIETYDYLTFLERISF